MNIPNMMKNIGKTLSGTASAAADAIGTGLGSLDGYVGKTVSETAGQKVLSKSSDILANESVKGIRREIAQGINDNASRIGNAVGSGAEGLIIGSAGGAVIGGVAGGVDEDETFIGGAVKGALIGGALGGIGGGISGAVHNNAGLMMNTSKDVSALAERISKWGVGMKDSVAATINNSPV